MKRISLSTELKDWVPGVYSTLESQLRFVSEFLHIESPIFHSGNCSSYSIAFDKCYELGLFDGLVRNLAILLRVRTLKLANPAETVKSIICQVAVEFSLTKSVVQGVYYNSESLVPKKLSELFVKFYNENFVN
jgi:hypothetical protein